MGANQGIQGAGPAVIPFHGYRYRTAILLLQMVYSVKELSEAFWPMLDIEFIEYLAGWQPNSNAVAVAAHIDADSDIGGCHGCGLRLHEQG